MLLKINISYLIFNINISIKYIYIIYFLNKIDDIIVGKFEKSYEQQSIKSIKCCKITIDKKNLIITLKSTIM